MAPLKAATMSPRNPITLLAAVLAVPLAALSVAACGGSGNSDATAAAGPPRTPDGTAATIGVASTSLGNVLVDSQGRTIYLFQNDQNDQNAGDANGQGVNAFGAAWYVMSPAGDAITSSGSSSNAGGGGSSSGY
jgi:hypothetical protein